MATELAKAYVQIIPSAQGIKGSITSAISGESSSAGTMAGRSVAKSMGGTLSKMGSSFIKAGAIATAVSVPIIAGIKKALGSYQVQMEAETKLTEIYKTRLGVGKKAVKQTKDLAAALQKEGVVGDEVALSGAQQLATFAKYPSTVEALMPAMNDLLVQQNGLNSTSGDAVNIANLFGKAMQGQTGALKRVGISFTDAQAKVLKYGTEEEKAAMLAKVINENVGNMNKEMAKTPLGKIQQMKNSLGDMAEGVGAALAPALSKVAEWVSAKIVPAIERLVAFMQANPIIAKIVLGITGLLAVGGPLLMIIGGIMSAVGSMLPMLAAFAGPIGIIVAGVAGVIAVLVLAYKKSETFRNAVHSLATALKTVLVGAFNVIKPIIQTIWRLLKLGAQILGTILAPAIRAIGKVFSVFGATLKRIGGVVKAFADKVKEKLSFSGLKAKVSEVFTSIKEKITEPITKAKELVKGAIDKIKGFFPLKLGKIFSGIKLPHFKISGGKIPWGIGGKGKKPTVGIEWYAKGGIMKRPTLFGGGEAGSEAIVPLTPFWSQMEMMADSIVGGVGTVMAGASGYGGDIQLDVYLYPSGPKMMEQTVKMYDTGKRRGMK
jgi:hypothetical protein